MDGAPASGTTTERTAPKGDTRIERTSDRDIVVSRTIDAPPRLVWEAWTRPELFQRWWVPRSLGMSLVACELDVRVGGRYRLAFDDEGSTTEFFGRYLEVTPPSRLAWTNDEGGGEAIVTTVTFEERAGRTVLTVHDRYPSKAALEEGAGSMDAMPETLDQLEALVAGLASGAISL